jgi:hypothetical protein
MLWHAVRDGTVRLHGGVPGPASELVPARDYWMGSVPRLPCVAVVGNPDAPPYELLLPLATARWLHRTRWALALAGDRRPLMDLVPDPEPGMVHLPTLRDLVETRKGRPVRLIARDVVYTPDAETWYNGRLARGERSAYVNRVTLGVDTYEAVVRWTPLAVEYASRVCVNSLCAM